MVATVEWRSERRGAQRPTAISVGGRRISVVLVEQWVEGPLQAGGPLVRVFRVETEDGESVRISSSPGVADRVAVLVVAR